MVAQARQNTIEDLYKVPGQAELVNGKIIRFPPLGFLPNYAISQIISELAVYARHVHSGYALGSTVAFIVDVPNRKSFCPDAAYYAGTPTGMKFPEGAPAFAVEVRHDTEYGPKAEKAIADKRADYFAAGTQIVWDVDMLSVDIIRAYKTDSPETFQVFRRGDIADAEPTVPGWTITVDDLFPSYSE
jgi:Uma2 family endonuclease